MADKRLATKEDFTLKWHQTLKAAHIPSATDKKSTIESEHLLSLPLPAPE